MTKKKDVMRPALWTPRPVEETIAIYADWAETYDADVTKRGYHTPQRIAAALSDVADPNDLILDFGCGTGLGGMALRQAGFQHLDGTDITAEMLERAQTLGIYDKTWLSQPGELSFGRGAYRVIVAAGVVSLGAAPPETLGLLVAKLNSGGLLALSFNDPTLQDNRYTDALATEIGEARVEVMFREHGTHLDDVDMGSDVIILRRR
ncbi:methyltransferase domain-containing protein [Cognatiyoonia sp. IB215446]|uniref:class I SAM-dependent DNA methyltransferase n=1 Tax=Cognatiyoonia sp. IB215446 TaxID=3097355 RepID=UPI002A11390F|nr:methyltransferase domain-containing protein [Cognatiyoonia sp. IB215446]MDX8348685.1 methyltransferase domain-containing protein [Cognatiyoonia sp. IB215446]